MAVTERVPAEIGASASPNHTVVALSGLTAILALAAAAVGLWWDNGGARVSVSTARGGSTVLYGRGLYHYDTVFAAAGQRGTDAVVLVIVLPLLVWSLLRYRRSAPLATPLLAGALLTVLYLYGSLALGTPTTTCSSSTWR